MQPRKVKFPRLNAEVTDEVIDRIKWACEKRKATRPGAYGQGAALIELVMEHLEPRPPEAQRGRAKPATTKRKPPKPVKRSPGEIKAISAA